MAGSDTNTQQRRALVTLPQRASVSTGRSGLVAALVALAPITIEVISVLARKWLASTEPQNSSLARRPVTSNVSGERLGRDTKYQKRWRGSQNSK